ncbi:hypothetical protein BU26DRAFT_438017 [Trematosphaeria pertusa]|uniref:Uncharacterized protein n=1 Tax=Trematosphaeria pertusa TaxID=390896 RepID=A0A6A6HYI9_9PLEO|nr:uncharacterized protein BU26DRAFT_438017 [Trematosphaeria pertusa]KAF2242848.1 hypothetical protein BU26DRAFT_438017 [Trematosphaeria pertusa]
MSLVKTSDAHQRGTAPLPTTGSLFTSSLGTSCASLSFALPTSLAFFKRLTWEQTPWTSQKISPHNAHIIASHLTSLSPHPIAPEAIQHALCFGVSYTSTSNGSKDSYPQLFVVFPHLRRDISRDEKFLRVWHDEVVKPAFDEAWKESGLVKVHGSERDAIRRLNARPSGTWTVCDAEPAESILRRLQKGNKASIHVSWPDWTGSSDPTGGAGEEGDQRAYIFDEAWISMKGMVDAHPDLAEMQEPFLLAVHRGNVDVVQGMDLVKVHERVGQYWEQFADSRFMTPESFSVDLY